MKSLPTISFFLILSSFFAYGCREEENKKKEKMQIAFLSQSCFSCHSPDVNAKDKIAPAMGEIRLRYRNLISSEPEFILAIKNYLTAPGFETTQNKDWVIKYGHMPKMSFQEKRLEEALTYLFHTEVDSPEWFQANQSFLEDKKGLRKILKENMTLLEIAQSSAQETKSLLGSHLMTELSKNGELQALAFCNTNAQKITKDKSNDLNVEIARVSNKARNPLNDASQTEVSLIQTYEEDLLSNQKLVPKTVETEDLFIAYFPIETNQSCLKCHGDIHRDIKKEVYQKIKSLYPKDLAVGYKTNQIRGLFKVSIKK